MQRAGSTSGFGKRGAKPGMTHVQSPLVVNVKAEARAGRKPTSHIEAYWPFYLGFGIPGLIFGAMAVALIVMAAGKPVLGILLVLIGLIVPFLGFLLSSLVLTRLFQGFRGGAETLGNVSSLTSTSAGFKIGAAIGFGLFLWFTPQVFGDPFTGNPSAPSAIIAQFLLKALGFMGFAGMIGSRLEGVLREKVEAGMPADPYQAPMPKAQPKVLPAPVLPDRLKNLLETWPRRAAFAIAGFAFIVQLGLIALDAGNGFGGRLVGAGLICLFAYPVLHVYFKLVRKVLRGASKFYGFVAGVR